MRYHLWNCAHTKNGTRMKTVFDSEHVEDGYQEALSRMDDPDIVFVEQYSSMTQTYYFFVRKGDTTTVEWDIA